nr:immunoglobulin light chain junction region [Macaca mulatta]
CQKYNSSPYSF